MAIDEGVIKFSYRKFSDEKREGFQGLSDFKRLHHELHKMGMLGFYEDHQVSYGNLSHKDESTGKIFVSSTDTGRLKELENENICQLVEVEVENNLVRYLGDNPPSSESMTHYFCYQTYDSFSWIAHIHHKPIWNYYLENNLPAISENVAYGTPEMAKEMKSLLGNHIETDPDLSSFSLAMAGHEDGVIYCTKKADECLNLIVRDLELCQK